MAHKTPAVSGYGDLSEVGRGGFAVVYRAHHAALDRDVALKVITNANLDAVAQRRFELECHAMGKLSWHPHIVPVFDAGSTEEGWPYLAMAFLERGSLADRLRQKGPFAWNEAAAVGIQVAGAMQAAHDAKMLHRDLKPENILIDPLGDCRLSDFGIAALADQGVKTDSGQILGSVMHAAPEVLGGQRATERSDVYSLGSTLYELLSGSPAFYAPTDESIVAIILRATSEEAPDLRHQGVPEPVAELIHRCLAKDPGRRPATARDLGELLQRIQHELGEPLTPLRLPAPAEPDERSTLRRVPRGRGRAQIVIDDLGPEDEKPRRDKAGRPILVVDTDETPPAVQEVFYSEPEVQPYFAAAPVGPPRVEAGHRTSRTWFWSALVASLIAVALTTTAIVVALSG